MRMLARSSFAVIALASVLTLGGCSAISGLFGGETVARDSETQEITEAGTADVFQLKVGDCLNDVDAEEVTEVPAVPCDQPHDNEIYYEFSMPDGEFPGNDGTMAAAEEECGPQFDTFVGLAYEESVLDWFPYTPTELSWTEAGDRVVQCVIFEPDVRTSGSLAGVAR
jgi:hypothetical protein